MRIVLASLFVFVALTSADDEASEFIIGGQDAAVGQFPHMVSIRYQQFPGGPLNHGCGGGILNTNWVLTAAHCLMSGNQQLIVAGALRLQEEGQRYAITRSIPHPSFRFTNSNWHDIGLVNVVDDIVFNNLVQPIPLNRREIRFPTRAVLSGHGHYTMDLREIRASEHLQYKNTTILTSFDCTARTVLTSVFVPEYRPIIYPGHICTLVQRGIGGCFGDSGSPLIANGGVVGVVSFGLSCARGAPDILARVSFYTRWIDATMRN